MTIDAGIKKVIQSLSKIDPENHGVIAMIFMSYPPGEKITLLLISQIYQDRLSL